MLYIAPIFYVSSIWWLMVRLVGFQRILLRLMVLVWGPDKLFVISGNRGTMVNDIWRNTNIMILEDHMGDKIYLCTFLHDEPCWSSVTLVLQCLRSSSANSSQLCLCLVNDNLA